MLVKRTITFFRLSMLSMLAATIGLACIPVLSEFTALSYCAAAVFWLGVIFQQVFFWIGNAGRKKMEQKVFRVKRGGKGALGIICFGSNRKATICDCVMFASIIAVVLEIAFSAKQDWLIMISLVALFLSFNLHCVLNGKNYRYFSAFYNHKKRSV